METTETRRNSMRTAEIFENTFPSKAAAAVMQRATIIIRDDSSQGPVAITGKTVTGRTVSVLLTPEAVSRIRAVLTLLLTQELSLQCEREETQGTRVTVVTPDKPVAASRFVRELAVELKPYCYRPEGETP
jgi:hypothetical protein